MRGVCFFRSAQSYFKLLMCTHKLKLFYLYRYQLSLFACNMFSKLSFFILAALFTTLSSAQSISPKQFGLLDAKSREECYSILYRTHCFAIEKGLNVSYSGIDRVYLEIPKNAKPIPLPDKTDFCGCTIYVSNTVKDSFPLFELDGSVCGDESTYEGKGDILLPNFSIQGGLHLLLVSDVDPWVKNRSGYNYGAIRKDVLLINKGQIQCCPIAPYTQSSFKAKLVKVTNRKKRISNLNFVRDSHSTQKTLLFLITSSYNVTVSNIKTHTPQNNVLYGDAIITVSDSYNICFRDISIDSTYSLQDKYGYAISLNNVASFKGINIVANGNWGVFCCSNIRDIRLDKCIINRFDLHCYGKDFVFNKCKFTHIGLPMSSFFGVVSYKDCIFERAVPIIYRIDYNAYTPYDVLFDNCVFIMEARRNYLIDLVSVPAETNLRRELMERCLPNVMIRNCSFVFDPQINNISIFNGIKTTKASFGHIKYVVIEKSSLNRPDVQVNFFDSTPHSSNTIMTSSDL